MMGVELVEGRDLVCTGGQVRMRTTHGDRPVDVIYRRVDDEFLDPVHFRGDSVLGVAGLVSAMRSGRVSVANAVGNGVADDKLIYSYLPDLIRFYLDEDPILPNVETFRCDEPAALAHVLDHLDEMVVKPVDGAGGKGLVGGPRADRATLDRLRAGLRSNPRGWIAQPVVQLSTVPTFLEGRLVPRATRPHLWPVVGAPLERGLGRTRSLAEILEECEWFWPSLVHVLLEVSGDVQIDNHPGTLGKRQERVVPLRPAKGIGSSPPAPTSPRSSNLR